MNNRAFSVIWRSGQTERISTFCLTLHEKILKRDETAWIHILKTTEANQDFTRSVLQNSSLSINLSTLREHQNRLKNFATRTLQRVTAAAILVALELNPFCRSHVRVPALTLHYSLSKPPRHFGTLCHLPINTSLNLMNFSRFLACH